MKKIKFLALLAVMSLSITGCGGDKVVVEEGGARVEGQNNSNPTDGIDATITVQAEKTWMPHYEAAAARVLAENPNASIELIEMGSFDVFDLIDSTDITNEDIADVFALPLDRVYGMAQNEVLAAIDAPAMAEKTNGGADLAILPLDYITLNGNPLRHWKSGWGLAVNARIEEDPAKMALAEEMIEEIVNPEYAENLFNVSGKILENVPVEVYQASELDDMSKNIIAATLESYEQEGKAAMTEAGFIQKD
ncbi:MAG: hypothetical protein ATN32_04320 [Candidatus Epulonipiscium fishelsonii]|nr:MAG: hypothetical protein ATN32_04320 [Epulopiscium sp. AS2M-Bin002]